MKILLQSEARNISDRYIQDNQQYLIGLMNKVRSFTLNSRQQKASKSSKTLS
ncbi:hypothetical protein H1P_440007 [Hyella patelloides LEGE 07179]|uniref:Uncharacterized protein n=1 Tax=Hyella patelloides LEGE 07179 TaxID=945734 RepID=A0A563VY52_9CYAN|nr:hypothetical protein [Hyella patelloides]VEP16349.1 hypothetical protein H1P_440007 [Hyella patelloides LEGE 07179]